MGCVPNFVVIGASRSGTTSLHHYLDQHPGIYLSPRKSPNYFVAHDPQPDWESAALLAMAKQWISSRDDYDALFKGVTHEKAVGEISPVYLQSVHVAKRLKNTLPAATKLIAILRNPAERAYAHYLGRRRDGLETGDDFNIITEHELTRPLPVDIAFGSYIACSSYYHFLKPYYEHFSKDNIRIYLFDQLQGDVSSLLRDLFSFLEVDPDYQVNTSISHNRSGIITNPLLRSLWVKSAQLRTNLRPYLPAFVRHIARPVLARQVSKPALAPATREKISSALRADTEQLQQLIGKDLSAWLGADSHLNT